eukprot:3840119-Prymnesium_polylepis.1
MHPCSTQTRRWQQTEESVQSTQVSARAKAGQVPSTIKSDAQPVNEMITDLRKSQEVDGSVRKHARDAGRLKHRRA